jgi:metal-sulfur cluster biosynthetic enzyme
MDSDDPGFDDEVAECLRDVLDPEIGLNVVDLGLVYVARRRGTEIDIALTLTSRACPLGELVLAQVRDCLARAYPGHELNVELVWSPAWTPDLITDRGYDLMGRERTRTLI